MQKWKLLKQMHEAGIVAVLRGKSAEEAIAMAEKAIEGGIRIIEVTMTVPNGLEAISELSKRKGVDAVIGAGTVLDAETARACIMAGAEFVVSPHLQADTVKLCHRYRIPVLPGVMTIKEITEALELGVDVVKLFPGNHYSPSFLSAIRGPLPHANVMPTGGVGLENLKDWIAAGAFAVGIGSDLTKEATKTGNLDRVTERARAYVEAFQAAKACLKEK